MNTKTTEQLEEVALRVPPGDRWLLLGDSPENIKSSIVEALSAYCTKTGFKGDYKLSPMKPQTEAEDSPKGVLYAIVEKVEEVVPKGYNIYGEEIQ